MTSWLNTNPANTATIYLVSPTGIFYTEEPDQKAGSSPNNTFTNLQIGLLFYQTYNLPKDLDQQMSECVETNL